MFQITVLILYGAASGLLAKSVLEPASDRRWLPVLALGLGAIGYVLHSQVLASSILRPNGLALDLGNVLSLLGWLIAAIALLAALRPHLRGLSSLLLPVSAIANLGTLLPVPEYLTTSLTWPLRAHILLAITAYSMFGIGAALALLIAAQDRRLRRRRSTGWLQMLPPLEALEQILFSTLGAGFLLLTLALFSGLIFVEDLFAQHLVHKSTLAIAGWLIFATLLIGRWLYGWRGRRAIRWTLVGFCVLALAYFGSKLILEVILGNKWG